MQRLVRYHKGIEKGLIKVDAKPEIVFETPVSAVIEGNDGMGQLLGHKAMEIAIEKAKTTGMAVVTVRNSNHYGIAGYYAKMAPKAEGAERIYTHGEKEVIAYEDRLENGIDVNINTVAEMVDLCNYLNMDVKEYLGEEAEKLTLRQSSYDM